MNEIPYPNKPNNNDIPVATAVSGQIPNNQPEPLVGIMNNRANIQAPPLLPPPKPVYAIITLAVSVVVLIILWVKSNSEIDSTSCSPVYWDNSSKSIKLIRDSVSDSDSVPDSGGVPDDADGVFPDASNYSSALTKTYQVQSNYNTSKNTYVMLLVLFVIGNSAPYYYFENLKNKDAWPSHGFGGLLRKLIVHCIGFYFLLSIFKYIASSTKIIFGSDNLDEKGCSYIACPSELLDGATMDTPLLIVTNDGKDHIKELIANSDFDGLKTKLAEDFGNIKDGKATTTTKTNSGFLFIIIVIFTVIFAHFLTIKGFPIYGVTYFYNPLSCFRINGLRLFFWQKS